MSSRQLKKLRAQEERARASLQGGGGTKNDDGAEDSENADSDDGDDDPVVDTRPRPKNVFAAFAALGGDDDDNENDEDEDEDEDTNGRTDEQDRPAQAAAAAAAEPRRGKPKKKKKKKAKAKAKKADEATAATATTATTAAVAVAESTAAAQPELDEIDRALQELNIKQTGGSKRGGEATGGDDAARTDTGDVPIKVHLADLRVLNELRDVFGRDIVHAAQAEDALGVPGRPVGEPVEGRPGMVNVDLETFLRADPPPPRGMVRINNPGGGGGMAGLVAKRNPFIQWKDTWPRATSGGLAMRQVTEAKAAAAAAASTAPVEFAFVHSPAYVQLEDTFYTLSLMMNPQALIQFLKRHPFHISSLIVVSLIAKIQDGNASLAADLCERALFSFGRATLSSFRARLAEGRARLDARRPENRQFLLAGYHYIRSLLLRGTYRTALAWTKLFLSVMPDDAYGLVLYAHALAVRAFDARWFVRYCGGPTTAQALLAQGTQDMQEALRTMETQRKLPAALRGNPMAAYVVQSLVPALVQAKDVEAARAVLAAGMARLPWLYGALCQALGLDVPRAVWGVTPRDDAEALYTQLYIHLAKDLWDVPSVSALLREASSSSSNMARPVVELLPRAAPVTLTIARFVYLDNTPALMALVPRAMLHAQPNSDFDPLPPPRDENVFSNRSQLRPWIMAESASSGDGGGGGGGGGGNMFLPPGMLDELDHMLHGDDDSFDDDGDDVDDGFYMDGDDDEDVEEIVAESRPARRPSDGQDEEPWRNRGGMPGAWYDDDDE